MSPNIHDLAVAVHYFSTYCVHQHHEDCRLTCKTCGAPCQCECHGKVTR